MSIRGMAQAVPFTCRERENALRRGRNTQFAEFNSYKAMVTATCLNGLKRLDKFMG